MDKEIKISPGVEIEKFSESGLRDYFAAKAMQGILANPSHSDSDERIVKDAWKIADQMMEARK